jgi:hypothetical protein
MIKTLLNFDSNLYFKSRLVFTLLKLNNTELLILMTELFFMRFRDLNNKAEKVSVQASEKLCSCAALNL